MFAIPVKEVVEKAVEKTSKRLKERKRNPIANFHKLHEAFERVGRDRDDGRSKGEEGIGKMVLKDVVDYKMAKGSFRPGFWSRIDKGNTDEQVRNASKAAITFANRTPDVEGVLKALEILTTLHGVGFATASYVLSRFSSAVPIMSDECLRWASNLSPTDKVKGYTKKDFRNLFVKLESKVKVLNSKDVYADDRWTLLLLSKAIWASAVTECPLKELQIGNVDAGKESMGQMETAGDTESAVVEAVLKNKNKRQVEAAGSVGQRKKIR